MLDVHIDHGTIDPVKGRRRRMQAFAVVVVVEHAEHAVGGENVSQSLQEGIDIWNEREQPAREDDVERTRWQRVVAHVTLDDLDTAEVSVGDRAAGMGDVAFTGIHCDHLTVFTDALGQMRQRQSDAAAEFQHALASRQPEAVEEILGVLTPHLMLTRQALHLDVGASE